MSLGMITNQRRGTKHVIVQYKEDIQKRKWYLSLLQQHVTTKQTGNRGISSCLNLRQTHRTR